MQENKGYVGKNGSPHGGMIEIEARVTYLCRLLFGGLNQEQSGVAENSGGSSYPGIWGLTKAQSPCSFDEGNAT